MQSVIAFLMLAFCFFTAQRHVDEAPPSSTSMREDLRDIWRNDQWRVVGVLTILNILAVCVRGGAMMRTSPPGSWARRCCSPPSSRPTASATLIGFGAGETADRLEMQSQRLLVDQRPPGGAQRGDVLRTDGRRNHHVCLYLRHWRTAPAGDANPVVMMSDTVDYGEWCNGKRLTGISFAGTLFVLKLGLALGGALIGWMLAGGGYDAPLKLPEQRHPHHHYRLVHPRSGVCYLLSAVIAKRYYTLKRRS